VPVPASPTKDQLDNEAKQRNIKGRSNMSKKELAHALGRDYSNSGYFRLGAIVAQVSGLSYDDYVRWNGFWRAGMSGAGCYPKPLRVSDPRFAHPLGVTVAFPAPDDLRPEQPVPGRRG
jgi:CubicO group peptidase (beta-lactamase class C family)